MRVILRVIRENPALAAVTPQLNCQARLAPREGGLCGDWAAVATLFRWIRARSEARRFRFDWVFL